jgi:probable addiction module antidote protein
LQCFSREGWQAIVWWIASQTGLSREQIYRSFSEKGNPTLKTTQAVMKALGVQLTTKIETAA